MLYDVDEEIWIDWIGEPVQGRIIYTYKYKEYLVKRKEGGGSKKLCEDQIYKTEKDYYLKRLEWIESEIKRFGYLRRKLKKGLKRCEKENGMFDG